MCTKTCTYNIYICTKANIYIYLHIYIFVNQSSKQAIHLGIQLSAYLSTSFHNPVIYPTIQLSNYPTINQSIKQSINQSIYLSIYLFIYPCIHPSMYSSIHPSIHSSIHPFSMNLFIH